METVVIVRTLVGIGLLILALYLLKLCGNYFEKASEYTIKSHPSLERTKDI